VRPVGVVVLSPSLDLFAGIVEIEKHLQIQALVPQPSIEAFDEPVLDRLAGTNEIELHAIRVCPVLHVPASELSAVIDSDRFGSASRGDEQIELLRHLEQKFGHVSYERVLSGPGLANIYEFLRARSGVAEPTWLSQEFSSGDKAAVVSASALKQTDPVCIHALEVFCDIYGAEAANLALKVLAFGGVYLGGGIAPKILPMLTTGGFAKGFLSKGRLNEILKRMEVRVALNPAAALIGAAHRAAAML